MKKPGSRCERRPGENRERNVSISENASIKTSLIDSLDGEWLKLPKSIMRDAGPATQTLGGLLNITNKETFVAVSKIAKRSRLPLATSRKHLVTLVDHGWIENVGRGHTRRGAPRRTCTLRITPKTREAMSEYGVLPWWACCNSKRHGVLRWSTKAVLSVIMARLMSLKAAIDRTDDQASCLSPDNYWLSICEMGGEDRFRFSLAELRKETGLSRHAVIQAKRKLFGHGIIELQSDTRDDGGDAKDILMPSDDFCVTITPAGEGQCYVEF
jgi:hypothetical protein